MLDFDYQRPGGFGKFFAKKEWIGIFFAKKRKLARHQNLQKHEKCIYECFEATRWFLEALKIAGDS